jgi:Leucine-rich repeat (LRR) protein
LEIITLFGNELTSLTVSDCPNLRKIVVRNNQLTKLEISGENKISEIIAGKNELTTLNCSDCSNLKKLMVPDNPSLAEIKGLN